MDKTTTIKKLFGICYYTQVKKMHYEQVDYLEFTKKVKLATIETYLFNIKIHTTQITF